MKKERSPINPKLINYYYSSTRFNEDDVGGWKMLPINTQMKTHTHTDEHTHAHLHHTPKHNDSQTKIIAYQDRPYKKRRKLLIYIVGLSNIE